MAATSALSTRSHGASTDGVDAVTPLNLLVALAAGVLSFVSPCMLPLMPGYVAWMGANPDNSREHASSPLPRALLFVAGFSTVFVVLGMGAGLLGGAAISARRPAEIVGGVAIVLLGVAILAERRLPMSLQRRIGLSLDTAGRGRLGALGFGAVFGAAWSPCIGPTLGAILALAAVGQQAMAGAVLLAVFAAGLAVPFVLLALGLGALERALPTIRRHSARIRTASGVILVIFGSLLVEGAAGQLSSRLAGVLPGYLI